MNTLDKVYDLTIDIKNIDVKYNSYAKFFDDDRETSVIRIKLLNDKTPMNLENCIVEAYFILADNTYHNEACKIINSSEGVVELQLCQKCLVKGENIVRLSILKDNEISNTPVITYEVRKGLYSDDPNFNDDPLTPVLSQMLLDVKVTKANQIELQERYEQSFPRIELKIKEVDEKIKEVNLAIASGTQDLEVKEARANKKGIVYTKLGDRLNEVDSQLEYIENNPNDIILYSFFRNSSNPVQNDLYISNDGDTLERINSQSVVGAKDPSIIYKNGWWLIAGTSYNPHDFTIYRSCDLVKWEKNDISVGLYNNVNNKIWAPEWFEDDNGDLYILLSVKVKEEYDKDSILIPSFKPYIIKCTNIDELEFSHPILLNLEDKNKIDPCLIKENGIYHMFIKDEYDKFTEHWTSTNLINWSHKEDIVSLGDYVEGQTIIKYNNKFYLYADAFKGDMGIVYYVTSDDLETWSERKAIKVGCNRVRHGTALVIKDNKAKQDIQKFILSNLAIPAHNMRSKGYKLSQFASEEGLIENLEIIDNCVYSITNNEHFIINSFKNTNNAKCFYLYLSTNDKGSITINCNNQIVGVPNGYVYNAEYGDNDTLIKFIYSESIGKFKPTTVSNAFLVKKNELKKGGWKTITLSSQTIASLDVEDGVVYRVNGGQDVVINDVSSSQSGTHFYLMLASGGSGSITINSGTNITVPGGSFVISKENNNNDCLIEFIKVNGSTFRLRK